MKYRIFNTEAEALAAEAQVAQAIGVMKSTSSPKKGRSCIKVGVNAKTGLPWAIPQQIADGRWVFVSPDDEGEESGEDWFTSENSVVDDSSNVS